MAKTKKSEKKSSKGIVILARHERSTAGTHVFLAKNDGNELPSAEETKDKAERDKASRYWGYYFDKSLFSNGAPKAVKMIVSELDEDNDGE